MKKYTDNPLFNDMANMVDTMSLEDQLEEVDFEISHLEWEIDQNARKVILLDNKRKEICGEIGHEWDETWVQCVKCGEYNPRQYEGGDEEPFEND